MQLGGFDWQPLTKISEPAPTEIIYKKKQYTGEKKRCSNSSATTERRRFTNMTTFAIKTC